jgi:protocatechuate 3,4-dioxygenase, alpha subunit
MTPATTPSQTVGPFFRIGLRWDDGPDVVPEGTPGAVWLRGRLLDGAGDPVPDGLVETWQADLQGRFAHEDDPRGNAGSATGSFRAFGRGATDEAGRWGVHTVKPGRVPSADGALQAPHVLISVFARGLMNRLVTRLYFADEAEANAEDPVLSALSAEEGATLLAAPSEDGYTLDLHLQGPSETTFFTL